MISQTAEYALRTIVWLAGQEGKAQTTQEIALRSRRGLDGGFALIGDPDVLTPLDVINAIDPIRRVSTCPLDLKTHDQELCALHKNINEAVDQAESVLNSKNITDILNSPSSVMPFCDC
jgi:DNA-binding IscR family transcriptional regulator